MNEFDANASHDYLAKSLAAIVGVYLFFFAGMLKMKSIDHAWLTLITFRQGDEDRVGD